MNLIERLNILIQAATISQKSGVLTLDEAVKIKSAIDVISSREINKNFTSSLNVLIEMAASSQKKGAYSLKDAYMIYVAIDGIENELQNEANKIQSNKNQSFENNNEDNSIITPPKKLRRNT